jgi:holo-[acyl-carrier protein] synthase
MTRRVGFDLVTTESVHAALTAHGERWLRRTFTAAERADCGRRSGLDTGALAVRIAAKEATFKVLRVDDRPVAWTDVEVHADESSTPKLLLSGLAANLNELEGIIDLSLSLSHVNGLAAAIVIAVTRCSADIRGER